MADDDVNQESAGASDEEEEAEEEEDVGEANVLSIENEASSPNELDSQAVDEILANFESKQKDAKSENALKMDPNFQEVFKIMGDASNFLCEQMEIYNSTLTDHVKLLHELNSCISFIDTRTSQLKELRNFVRRQSTSLDQIFPHFFKNENQFGKGEEK